MVYEKIDDDDEIISRFGRNESKYDDLIFDNGMKKANEREGIGEYFRFYDRILMIWDFFFPRYDYLLY